MNKEKNIQKLEYYAATIRHHIINMIGHSNNKTGHLGGACSLADIVAALYFYKMRHDPNNPADPHRDRFILSKGHAALVQYAALAECGYFPKNDLSSVKQLGSHLQGHPDALKTPGIEANTGSLGQGLSIGLGMALGLRMSGSPAKVYVAMGDGEQAEGQIWEAALCAANYKTNNLIAILDNNKVQASDIVEKVFPQHSLQQRWESFGWHVISIDGHNMKEICEALDQTETIKNKPVLILANTVKGKGISFAEGNAKFHNASLSREQFNMAHDEINNMTSFNTV